MKHITPTPSLIIFFRFFGIFFSEGKKKNLDKDNKRSEKYIEEGGGEALFFLVIYIRFLGISSYLYLNLYTFIFSVFKGVKYY